MAAVITEKVMAAAVIPADKDGAHDMAKLLVAEDNSDYRELLYNFLESAGYDVTTVADGKEALSVITGGAFDLILLDVMLPGLDGYGVCEQIRSASAVPVIMLTALDSEEHQLRGYRLLIDGYITKPVSMALLLQKVEAVLRRTMKPAASRLEAGGISMDLLAHTVRVSGKLADFTLREFEILQELLARPGEVIARKDLVTKLWGYDNPDEDELRVVDTHMKNIRKKLSGCGCIETVRGVGYRLRN